MFRRALTLVVGLGAVLPGRVEAACPARSDADVTARITEVDAIIDAHAGDLDLWYSGFSSLHLFTIATSATLYNVFEDRNVQRQAALTAFSSSLGAISLAMVTPPLIAARDTLDARPRETPADRRAYLAAAEAILDRQRARTRFTKSWWARGISLAYVTASSLVVWLAFDRPLGALQNLAGGLTIGQGQIYFHPTGAADAYDAYEARHGCRETPVTARVGPDWTVAPAPGGLGFVLRF